MAGFPCCCPYALQCLCRQGHWKIHPLMIRFLRLSLSKIVLFHCFPTVFLGFPRFSLSQMVIFHCFPTVFLGFLQGFSIFHCKLSVYRRITGHDPSSSINLLSFCAPLLEGNGPGPLLDGSHISRPAAPEAPLPSSQQVFQTQEPSFLYGRIIVFGVFFIW